MTTASRGSSAAKELFAQRLPLTTPAQAAAADAAAEALISFTEPLTRNLPLPPAALTEVMDPVPAAVLVAAIAERLDGDAFVAHVAPPKEGPASLSDVGFSYFAGRQPSDEHLDKLLDALLSSEQGKDLVGAWTTDGNCWTFVSACRGSVVLEKNSWKLSFTRLADGRWTFTSDYAPAKDFRYELADGDQSSLEVLAAFLEAISSNGTSDVLLCLLREAQDRLEGDALPQLRDAVSAALEHRAERVEQIRQRTDEILRTYLKGFQCGEASQGDVNRVVELLGDPSLPTVPDWAKAESAAKKLDGEMVFALASIYAQPCNEKWVASARKMIESLPAEARLTPTILKKAGVSDPSLAGMLRWLLFQKSFPHKVDAALVNAALTDPDLDWSPASPPGSAVMLFAPLLENPPPELKEFLLQTATSPEAGVPYEELETLNSGLDAFSIEEGHVVWSSDRKPLEEMSLEALVQTYRRFAPKPSDANVDAILAWPRRTSSDRCPDQGKLDAVVDAMIDVIAQRLEQRRELEARVVDAVRAWLKSAPAVQPF